MNNRNEISFLFGLNVETKQIILTNFIHSLARAEVILEELAETEESDLEPLGPCTQNLNTLRKELNDYLEALNKKSKDQNRAPFSSYRFFTAKNCEATENFIENFSPDRRVCFALLTKTDEELKECLSTSEDQRLITQSLERYQASIAYQQYLCQRAIRSVEQASKPK